MLFLLTKCDELKLDDDCITRVLDALISFYVRRNITLVPKASNIRARMLKLVQDIRGSSDLRGDELVDRVIKELKELSVSDEQFATAITSDGMYDKNAKTTRFVLIEVERYLNRTTNTSLFDNIRTIWTITRPIAAHRCGRSNTFFPRVLLQTIGAP